MFDMKEVGARIARYRRQKNLTQMNLADLLGISFQAVSNWERGESMPDISKLGELSQVLGVSIDVLLGNVPSDSEVDAEDFVAEEILEDKEKVPDVENESEKDEGDDTQREYFRRVMATIPYMDSDDVAEIVSDLLNQGVAFEDITPAFAFLDSDYVAEFAMDCLKNGATLNDLSFTLGHMDSDDVADVVKFALENGEDFDAVNFAFAYMDSDDIVEFVKASVKRGSSKSKTVNCEPAKNDVNGDFGNVFDKAMGLLSSVISKNTEKRNSNSETDEK